MYFTYSTPPKEVKYNLLDPASRDGGEEPPPQLLLGFEGALGGVGGGGGGGEVELEAEQLTGLVLQ